MTEYFFPVEKQDFSPHPVYDGVQLARLVGKEDGQPVGVLLLQLDPGVEIPVHVHEANVDSIFVVSGRAELFVAGRWQAAEAGTYLLAPAGEEHGVRNPGRDPLLLFIHHSPALM